MSKFISTSNLRKLADALQARYKDLVEIEKERSMEAENNLQTQVDITQSMLGGKSIVYITQSEFDNLTEAEKNDNSKTYFITDAVDTSHTHENKDFLDNLAARNITIGSSTKTFDGANNLSYSLDEIGVASKEHNHDDKYYTETEINTKLSELQSDIESTIETSVAGKADIVHNHDDKYYTETEINTKLSELQTEINMNIADEKERAMEVESALQAEIDVTQDMLGGKSIKYVTQAEYDALSESEKNNPEVLYLVTDAVDTSHTHENKDFLDNLAARNITIGSSTKVFDGANNLSYSLEEIGVAPSGHNHDDRYYTETEIDDIIDNVNDSLNTAIINSKNEAINASNSYADTAIANLVDSAPEAMNTLNELANAIKDHQDEYEAYISTVASNIATAKSEAISEAVKKDEELHTTISAEIDADVADEKERAMEAENILQAEIDVTQDMLGGKSIKYVTQAEYDALSEAEKNDPVKAYFITDASDTSHTHENKDFLDNLAARNITIGSSTKVFDGANNLSYSLEEIGAASKEHNHDDRYYTETEIDGKIEDINETINTNLSSLQSNIATAKAEAISEAVKKDTELHTTISAEIDADITDEKERAMEAENALQAEVELTKDMLGGKSLRYVTQEEYNNLSEEEEYRTDIVWNIIDAEDCFSGDYNDLENKPLESKTVSKTVTFEFDGVEEGKTICEVPSITCRTGIKIADLTAEDRDAYVESIRSNGCIVTYEDGEGNIITETLTDINSFAGYCDYVALNNGRSTVIFSVEPWEWYINHANHYATEPGIYFVRNGSGSLNVLKIEIPTNETVTVYNSKSDIFINNNKVVTEDYVQQEIRKMQMGDTEIVLAINELQTEINNLDNELDTKIEDINETINNKEAVLNSSIQNLTNNKADISYVNGKLSVVDAIKLNGYSLWVGTSSELDAITTKDPNTLYFEIDDGTGEEVVQVNVTNGVLQLTTDKYQKTNMLDGTTIVFPAVNRFTEIHLYFNAGINMNLNFPDCKWRVDPNIEEGNSYELIATYNTMDWLVNLIVYS